MAPFQLGGLGCGEGLPWEFNPLESQFDPGGPQFPRSGGAVLPSAV